MPGNERTPLTSGPSSTSGSARGSKIIYVVICRSDLRPECLVEKILDADGPSSTTGNFQLVTANLLRRPGFPMSGKKSYKYDANYSYHCLIEDGIDYICLAETGVKLNVAYKFLSEVKTRCTGIYSMDELRSMRAQSLRPIKPQLDEIIRRYNDAKQVEKYKRIQATIDDVKGVMVENIGASRSCSSDSAAHKGVFLRPEKRNLLPPPLSLSRSLTTRAPSSSSLFFFSLSSSPSEGLLERQEKIEIMVNRTDNLQQSSLKFKKGAWNTNCKQKIRLAIITAVIVLVVLVIVAIIGYFAVIRPIVAALPKTQPPTPAPAPQLRLMN